MTIFFGILILGISVLGWAFYESRLREINQHSVCLKKKIPKQLRILHLSDIHFSKEDARLSLFFDRLATETYDLVIITGDIFDCESGIPAGIENLKKLKNRFGSYAVFGNHDYYDYHLLDIATMGLRGRRHPDTIQPVHLFTKALKDAGVRLLRNESVSIQCHGTTIAIHGLDDPTTGQADIEKTMHQYAVDNVNLILSHTIDAFFYIGENEMDLSFSGHSHGGQIRFPLVGPLITHTQYGPRYASGIHTLKGAICSISRGMGASRFFFLRLLCRPEAILLNVSGEEEN